MTFTDDPGYATPETVSLNDEKIIDQSETEGTSVRNPEWKPRTETTYETLVLTQAKSQFNCKVRGAGFRTNGKMRHIKKTCLLAKIKTRCRIRKRDPALAICITMYNEDE